MLDFPPSPSVNQVWPDPRPPGVAQWRWTGQKWIGANPGTPSAGFPDADSDGQTYGRRTGDWQTALPITGGTLSGPLTVNGTITGSTTVTAPDFITTLGGGTRFAWHLSGSYLYVSINGGAWQVLATEQRIWDVCRHVVNHENPGVSGGARDMRLAFAGSRQLNPPAGNFDWGEIMVTSICGSGRCITFPALRQWQVNYPWGWAAVGAAS